MEGTECLKKKVTDLNETEKSNVFSIKQNAEARYRKNTEGFEN